MKKQEALTHAWGHVVTHIREAAAKLEHDTIGVPPPTTFVEMMQQKAGLMRTLVEAIPMTSKDCPYCNLYYRGPNDSSFDCASCEYGRTHGRCGDATGGKDTTIPYQALLNAIDAAKKAVGVYATSCPEPKDEPRHVVRTTYGGTCYNPTKHGVYDTANSAHGVLVAEFPVEGWENDVAAVRAKACADALNAEVTK
ncbi:MAG: hypothetical protein WC700_17090 [Gemmatimonadaceae bacterium]